MQKLTTEKQLSLLWIVVMFNMIFNDIYSIMIYLVEGKIPEVPGEIRTLMAIAAIITNIPIFMVLLSRWLPQKGSRIANIAAGIFTILYVVGGGSLDLHYIIVASIEVILLLIIIVKAWKWKLEGAS